MIIKFFKSIFLIDIFKALFVGVKCIFRKPVTRDIKYIKRCSHFRRCFSIDPSKCIGCRVCSSICPNKSIKIIDIKHYVFYKNKCSYCGLCERVCPKSAIKFSDKDSNIKRD